MEYDGFPTGLQGGIVVGWLNGECRRTAGQFTGLSKSRSEGASDGRCPSTINTMALMTDVASESSSSCRMTSFMTDIEIDSSSDVDVPRLHRSGMLAHVE